MTGIKLANERGHVHFALVAQTRELVQVHDGGLDLLEVAVDKATVAACAEAVGAICAALHPLAKFSRTQGFVGAISAILQVEGFDQEAFLKRCENTPGMIQKQPDMEHYAGMFETIYNYRNSSKLPLAFLAFNK